MINSLGINEKDISSSENNLFSVVCPIYNESVGLSNFINELTKAMESLGKRYEIIFVDDGSTDNSLQIIKLACDQNASIKGISFSRNFGHQHAVMAGLRKSSGKAVAVIDGDGQDPPVVLKQLFNKWEEGYDVVYGIRKKRNEGLLKNICYLLFYRILRLLVSFDMPLDSGDFSVMSRNVVDFLVLQREQNPYIRGLRSWWGGKQIGVSYERPNRLRGKTKYSLVKLFLLGISGVTSFSLVPLRISIVLGLFISLSSIVYAIYNIFLKLVYGSPRGYPSIIVAITFLGGLIIFLLGIIGEYIGHIFEDIRNRPQYIINREL